MNSPDPRNRDLIVHVNGQLVPRAEAKISVFDSAVQGGDAVWEGLRVYKGRIAELDGHLQRLQNSAKTLAHRFAGGYVRKRQSLGGVLQALQMSSVGRTASIQGPHCRA